MIFAFGLGMGLSPLTNAATSTVPLQEVGVASSVLALARNISGAFGVAIFATILTDSTTSSLVTLQKYSVIHSFTPSVVQTYLGLLAVQANVLAYTTVFHIAGIFLAVGGIAALFVNESPHDFEGKREHVMVEI